jgi:hypothetical protein
MIVRRRGDTHTQLRWRPSPTLPAPPAPPDPDELLEHADELKALKHVRTLRPPRRGLIGVATIIVVAVIAAEQHAGHVQAVPPLPATPAQWVKQWTSASREDDPARACKRLFAPALTHVFDVHGTDGSARACGSAESASARIRRVRADRDTVIVQAQQPAGARHGTLDVVLGRLDNGWQGVAVVHGGSIRAA